MLSQKNHLLGCHPPFYKQGFAPSRLFVGSIQVQNIVELKTMTLRSLNLGYAQTKLAGFLAGKHKQAEIFRGYRK